MERCKKYLVTEPEARKGAWRKPGRGLNLEIGCGKGKLFHITHLMEKVKSRGGRVGCFPVSEDSWHDMGEWPEYLRMIKVL